MKPKHVAIILDGNRRFAKRLMLEPWKGHEFGAEKVRKLFDWCADLGVKELTLYAFSLENFNRPKKEFDYLMKLFKKEFSEMLEDKKIHDKKVRIRFIGKIELFDTEMQKLVRDIEEATKNYSNFTINFAMAYGGRQEIVEACRKLSESGEEINEDNLRKNLWLCGEPEMIIRTGGEKRTSNFLPFQATYSEWFFLEKTWPEFEKEDFTNCIQEFEKRERRLGK